MALGQQMSTDQQNRPESRQSPDSVRTWTSVFNSLKNNSKSIRQALAVIGVGAIVFGVLIWIFLRGLEGPSFIVMGVGLGLLIVDAGISLATVRQALFGRRGRYGLNTAIVFVTFVAIAVIVNFTLYWAGDRPNPAGWLRVDTTATKQFLLEEQVVNTLKNLKEPVKITAFFVTDTAAESAAWRDTQDMLSEFRRRSSAYDLEYELVDPDLNPNIATALGVTRFPALAIEGVESRRTEVVVGLNPNTTSNVFTEQQVVTSLLVINQIAQKKVIFITGHSERDVTDTEQVTSFGLAGRALNRENYVVLVETLQELGTRIAIGDPQEQPAALVFAGPTRELLPIDQQVLLEYARSGGSILFMFEPEETPDSFKQFLSRYAVSIGTGEAADVASFVAPSPTFIQIKKSNSQLPPHPVTEGFEVLYMPGSTHFGWAVDPQSIPLAEATTPLVRQAILASTTLSSWSETDPDTLEFNVGEEIAGPLPVAVVIEAVGELTGGVYRNEDGLFSLNMIAIGDTDFASNNYFGSANNADLFVNAVNFLARDFELISIRSKTESNRQLFLTRNERDFVRWSGWLLMPGLISLFGFWTWWRRR
ncbi:MAG: Gldg family protein [Chloroflexi bacterium]|nr:Gldg family protein [Chloroflexota bacterium]